MSHRIVAGSDLFLMPSRYEPCGLNQMYSLRYGTSPVVRATGGLRDTVTPWDPATGSGNGFLFDDPTPAALAAAVGRAIAAWADPGERRDIRANGMAEDNSWGRSAAAYETIYRQVLAARGAGGRTS
jgi:starch synthase